MYLLYTRRWKKIAKGIEKTIILWIFTSLFWTVPNWRHARLPNTGYLVQQVTRVWIFFPQDPLWKKNASWGKNNEVSTLTGNDQWRHWELTWKKHYLRGMMTGKKVSLCCATPNIVSIICNTNYLVIRLVGWL